MRVSQVLLAIFVKRLVWPNTPGDLYLHHTVSQRQIYSINTPCNMPEHEKYLTGKLPSIQLVWRMKIIQSRHTSHVPLMNVTSSIDWEPICLIPLLLNVHYILLIAIIFTYLSVLISVLIYVLSLFSGMFEVLIWVYDVSWRTLILDKYNLDNSHIFPLF